jgi:hypothetical protein
MPLALSGMLALASAACFCEPAVAVDYKFSFNQRPYQTYFSLMPDGSFSEVWQTYDGLFRPAGDYEVEGFIEGLQDAVAQQIPASIVVTKSSHDPLSIGTYSFMQGRGFDVYGGNINHSYWIGALDSAVVQRRLIFSARLYAQFESGPPNDNYIYDEAGWRYTKPFDLAGGICACMELYDPSLMQGSQPLFSALDVVPPGPSGPSSPAVPGPLPLVGAAMGYRFSRTLRRQILK